MNKALFSTAVGLASASLLLQGCSPSDGLAEGSDGAEIDGGSFQTFSSGSTTGFDWINLPNDFYTKCWKRSGTSGSMHRTWSGGVSSFGASWDLSAGNAIPVLNRYLAKDRSSAYGRLDTMPEDYRVSWSGSGSVTTRGSTYDFGLYFAIHPADHYVGWSGGARECYIVTSTSRARSQFDSRMTYLGTVGSFKCYKHLHDNLWQLWAVRTSNSWSEDVNVQKVIKHWADSSGLIKMSSYYLGVIGIMAEVYKTKGSYDISGISIPKLDEYTPNGGGADGDSAGDNIVANGGFEHGLSPWGKNADAISAAQHSYTSHTGSYSGKCSHRTSTWHGIKQDVIGKIQRRNYSSSFWIRPSAACRAKLTLKLVYGGNTVYKTLAAKAVKAWTWTHVTGSASVSWTGALSTAYVYVELTDAKDAYYYLDDVEVM